MEFIHLVMQETVIASSWSQDKTVLLVPAQSKEGYPSFYMDQRKRQMTKKKSAILLINMTSLHITLADTEGGTYNVHLSNF